MIYIILQNSLNALYIKNIEKSHGNTKQNYKAKSWRKNTVGLYLSLSKDYRVLIENVCVMVSKTHSLKPAYYLCDRK